MIQAGPTNQVTGRFDPELVECLPQSLKFISHNGAGYDQVDAKACIARGTFPLLETRRINCAHRQMQITYQRLQLAGISVSNTPKAVDASTADTAMLLLLGAIRRIHTPYTAIRAGQWRGAMSLGHDAEGKTLGILGMGGIGNALAKRAQAFDLKIQYHNRHPVPDEDNVTHAKYVSLEELFGTSDILSIHLPLSDATRHYIGKKEFEMMKDGITIINTARGPIIDEELLVQGLDSGKVYAAGLDVYEKEPEVHEGLIKSDRVIILPHVGTATVETQVSNISSTPARWVDIRV